MYLTGIGSPARGILRLASSSTEMPLQLPIAKQKVEGLGFGLKPRNVDFPNKT